MITADEARLLDPARQLEADLAKLDAAIRKVAAQGEHSMRAPYAMCTSSGYDIKFTTPGVEDALKEAGFHVSPRSEARQFVDVWIEISWEPKP